MSKPDTTGRCGDCRWLRDLGEPVVPWGRCVMTIQPIRMKDDMCGQHQPMKEVSHAD